MAGRAGWKAKPGTDRPLGGRGGAEGQRAGLNDAARVRARRAGGGGEERREKRSEVALTRPPGSSRDCQCGPRPAHLAQRRHVPGRTWQGAGCQAHRPGSASVSLTWAGPRASPLNSPEAEPTGGDPGLRQEVSEIRVCTRMFPQTRSAQGQARLAWGQLGLQSGRLR